MNTLPKIPSSEITSKDTYLTRRNFLKSMGIVGGALTLATCGVPSATPDQSEQATPTEAAATATQSGVKMDELGDEATSYKDVSNFNNYYEFTTDKEKVAGLAKDYPTSPWRIAIGGLVNNPQTLDLDDIAKFQQEERIYRMRCVEGWSMVIPWFGFTLAQLLEKVEPKPEAKYVRFETVDDPEHMPGLRSPWYQWPYVEGLRVDEAMNDLTLLATGIYGESLLPQNGAPVRLVVPWKYGFKSIKSIVKIDLVEEQPNSLWMAAAPNEYGFYANVNPDVSHPRWSQRTERRIGDFSRRETLPFNGYGGQVAQLYDGMDLSQNY